MKILYAFQGTGNGHLSRARDIIPLLMKNNEVDILISGTQADMELPFGVKYRFNGLGFIFGANGGVDIVKTYKKNFINRLFNEIESLPVQEYDLVINDFEPVSAWACYFKNITSISISHQSAVLNKKAPRPKKIDIVGKAILKYYAPTTTRYGFHFKAYDTNIFTPVIRSQVREQTIKHNGHYTVYLPAYDDKRIIKVLKLCGDSIQWQVFSKHNNQLKSEKNITIRPIENEAFIESLASSAGVLCGAGFETPAEALFMKKKLMVIPMKGQYEQLCNAAALKEMGIPVLKNFKIKNVDKIKNWIKDGSVIDVQYSDQTEEIITKILDSHSSEYRPIRLKSKKISAKKFRNLILTKLMSKL